MLVVKISLHINFLTKSLPGERKKIQTVVHSVVLCNINKPKVIHCSFLMHFPLNLAQSQNYCSKIPKTFNEKHKTHVDKVGKYMCVQSQ